MKDTSHSMHAAVFRGPYNVAVETRPRPILLEATDAVVKVQRAAVCGSELHAYRGNQNVAPGYIMGHEFVGVVSQVGSQVDKFRAGDHIVCTFSVVCSRCFFCKLGHTNRCVHGDYFGSPTLNGGTASYVRVPHADGTMLHAPESIPPSLMVLMCDIFPTGYFAAKRAANGLATMRLQDATVVCIGCGPVGLCSVAAAVWLGFGTVVAVDTVEERIESARGFGANVTGLRVGLDDVESAVKTLTQGRGADAAVELVGNRPALRLAFDVLRPCGTLSSVGFHQADSGVDKGAPFSANELYMKSPSMHFGRVPVRNVYEEALACFETICNNDNMSKFVSHEMSLSDARQAFELFEQAKATKVVLVMDEQ